MTLGFGGSGAGSGNLSGLRKCGLLRCSANVSGVARGVVRRVDRDDVIEASQPAGRKGGVRETRRCDRRGQ